MAHFLIDKRSMEMLAYELDFSDLLSDNDTLLSPTLTSIIIKDSQGVDRKSLILQVAQFSGKVVTLVLKDGIDGEDYNIWVTGQGDVSFATRKPTRVIELRVRDTLVGNL